MLQKISAYPLTVYLAVTGFFRNLKEDERGLSGVVVAVLLILVAVLAVVLIWTNLGKWIGELWTRIVGEAGKI